MISEQTLLETSQRVAELLGLNFPRNRWNDLERGLLSAAKELGFGNHVENVSIWLEGKNFTKHELETLTNHLTVGETYFFRDKAILDVFREKIIPEILTERFGKSQHINIWSAGCCTGEEPYTLAILLLETIPDIQHWNISILATDINRNYLQKARDGIYSNWSFRETPENIRDRYFSKVKNGWSIAPEIKKLVQFAQLNLCEDSYPSTQTQTNSLDIIFCRNVLMYFSQELIQSIGNKFYDALIQGGWFITSPVEMSDENFPSFAKIQYEKSIVYNKSEKKVKPFFQLPGIKQTDKQLIRPKLQAKTITEIRLKRLPNAKPKTETVKDDPLEVARHYFNKKHYQKCADYCLKDIARTNNSLSWLNLLVKSYANLGRYDEALSWGTQLLKLDGMNVETYYLIASIQTENNAFTEAESMLKRGLYIDQTHILSHLLLGNVYLSLGNSAGTLRHFLNVSKLLAPFDENIILEGSEGHTVGSIRSMVESLTGEVK